MSKRNKTVKETEGRLSNKLDEDENIQPTLQSVIESYLDKKGTTLLVLVLVFSTILRAVVGLSYYSGEDMPPKFGDFECHRHWMTITHHTPVREWYTDGPLMNYSYWPMDYPPLCAYTHWLWSQIIDVVEPNAI